MKNPLITLLSASLIVVLTLGSVFAGELTPVGKWQTTTGESRYEVSLCGDGTKLCAKLIWLRADARTKDNMKYLNSYVVRGAAPSAPNKWRGTVHYAGEKLGGSVTQLAPDKLKLNGCKLILCQSIEFQRI